MIPKSVVITVEVVGCKNCPAKIKADYGRYTCDYDNDSNGTDGDKLYDQNWREMTKTCPLWIASQPKV